MLDQAKSIIADFEAAQKCIKMFVASAKEDDTQYMLRSLHKAKKFVDAIQQKLDGLIEECQKDAEKELEAKIDDGDKIGAIMLYRDSFDVAMSEANAYIEERM